MPRTTILSCVLALVAATVSPQSPVVGIHEVQGAAHISPYTRDEVVVRGVVTATTPRGFYLESLQPDDDPGTSEGLYVDTYRTPDVRVGDIVAVSGRVAEEYPGGSSSGSLPVTTIKRPRYEIESRGAPLPEPVTLGAGGRLPPGEIISNDAEPFVEESFYDPDEDAIDFYESLENMRVTIRDAISVAPVNTQYGEIWVVPDGGANAGPRTARGGITVRDGDLNPERVLVDVKEDIQPHRVADSPLVLVGDAFTAPIVGIMTYSYYHYKVLPLEDLPAVRSASLPREVAAASDDPAVLSVAAFNVQNLSGTSPQEKFDDIARTVVTGLAAPDLVLLSEIQDSDGAGRSGSADSSETSRRLVLALAAVPDAPDYRYVDIAPEYNADGGQPHANIRVGFLYRPSRVELIPDSLDRIAPDAPAFVNARKPLAARFVFRGRTIHAVSNHFSSKGGDGALLGRIQPPNLNSEASRVAQAEAVAKHYEAIIAADPGALVIVGGDLNDFAFSLPLRVLEDAGLTNLATELPDGEVYSYIYEGNSQALDHIFASPALYDARTGPADYVHRYAEYLYEERHSDHDPVLVRFRVE